MITFFNKLSNSWIAKIILGVLLLSMTAFWGLSGLTNLSYQQNDAITVGKISISTQQLAQAFDEERRNLSLQIGGKYISPAQALEFGLLEKAAIEQRNKLIFMQIKEDLDLSASNEAVQKYVETNPVFHDATGKFDKNIFYAFLRQRDLSETMLAHQLKDTLSYNHLKDTLADLSYAPNEITALSYAFTNEKRDVSALFIKPSGLTVQKQATEEDLKNYYEGYSENFMKPEYRKINLLTLTPDMMSAFITIDEATVQSMYEQEKDKYNTPEERDLLQLFFKTKEEATTALSSLNAENFLQTARDMGQSDEATLFGFTAKNQLAEELQEPVFSMAQGGITDPIESQTGYHVFYVKEIKPAVIADETTVKSEIRKSLVANQTYDKLADVSRQLEDLLGEGQSLDTAAQSLQLTTTQIEPLDIASLNAKGEKNNLVTPELMKEVFTLKQGDVSSLVEHNNGYLVAQVVEIEPVGIKSFEDVKDEIIALYNQEQQKAQFEETVNALKEKALKGFDLDTLAKEVNGELIHESDLSRTTENQLLKPHVPTIFTQQTGIENIKLTIAPNNAGAVLTIVNDVKTPTASNDEKELIPARIAEEQRVADALNEAVFSHYMTKLKVKINQKAINQIRSLYQNQK